MDKSTQNLYWNIGNRIRDLRIKQNFTVEQLAEKSEISTKYLYQIESGRVNFSTGILCRICNALEVSSTIILEEGQDEITDEFTDKDKKYYKSILIELIKKLK